MELPDEMTIPLGKAKIALMIGGSAGFVLLGFWLFRLSDAEIGQMHRSPLFVHGAGLAAMAFFGLTGLFGFRKLFDTGPGLRFTRQGIIDSSSGLASTGLVPWSDITGFDIHKIRSTRILVVKLADPERYVAAGNGVRRRLAAANLRLCGSPVTMSSSALAISFDRLLELCRAYLARYGKPASR
jgi:hypothetical protein